MKKLLKYFVTLCLSFTLCAVVGCSKQSSYKEYTSVIDLSNDDYSSTQSTWDPETNAFKSEYINDGHDSFYFVEATMTESQYDELNNINIEAEDEDEINVQTAELLDSLDDLKITCQNDNIPDDDTFSQYIGKTLGELDENGYCSFNTRVNDEGYYEFYRYNDEYVLLIQSDEKADDPSVLPEDDTVIEIKDISFYEFSLQ